MTTTKQLAAKAIATAMAAALCTHASYAAMAGNAPVAVWDGAAGSEYDFSTLTRTTSGDVTYTLNLNPVDSGTPNTVAADKSYIVIGDKDAQPGITITAGSVGVGSGNTLSVIMKCRNMPVSATSNRAIISLMDGNLYKYGGTSSPDNGAVVGVYNNAGTSGWIWKGSTASMAKLTDDFLNTASGAFSADEQIVALTYSGTGGTAYYVNGSLVQSHSGLKASELNPAKGIALGGVDVATGSQFNAMKNMQIEAIAIFDTTLSADEVAAYTFQSEKPVAVDSDMSVSEINAYSSATDLYLAVADGVTITGDATFTAATTVHFICNGSFTITPPVGNTATFDFSRVTGQPVVAYSNSLPSISGSVFTATSVPTSLTDASSWTGTIWLKNISGITGNNFLPNDYGNSSSTLRLTGISGWLWTDTSNNTINPAVELYDGDSDFALNLSDGYGYGGTGDYYTRFAELKGSGTLVGYDRAAYVVLQFCKWSDFTGTLSLTNKNAVFGATLPTTSEIRREGGKVWVMDDAELEIPAGAEWHAPNGVKVRGSLSYASLQRLSKDTAVELDDSGVVSVTGSGNKSDFANDFSKVSGTGAIKYVGPSWGGISTNNLSSTLGVILENTAGVIVPNALAATPTESNVIETGYLSGTGKLRCDYNWDGSGANKNRTLRVLQDRDSDWKGTHNDNQNRLTLAVAPGASTAGTLTLSGTQTQSAALTVEAGAKVNLTGTWVGATTVAGTLGGTGAITGNLTLSDGATLKVDDLSHALTVSGSLTVTGAITIELPKGAEKGMVIMTGSKPDISGATFSVKVGGETKKLKVTATDEGLKVGVHALLIRIM